MAWLRLDDGFVGNTKIVALTDRQFRVWVRTLCYCARAEDPTVDSRTIREVPGLTPKLVSKLVSLSLLDRSQETYEIHDWIKYLPKDKTGAERQARWRARRRNQANTAPDSTVTFTVTPTVTEPLREPSPESLPSRAHDPSRTVPSGSDSKVVGEETAAGSSAAEPAADLEELRSKAGAVAWWPGQVEAGERDPKRALAWFEAAARSADKNPGAYAWTGFESGEWPTTQNGRVPADLFRSCLNYVSSPEALDEVFTEDKLLEEFERKGHKLRQSLSTKQRDELVGKWVKLRAEAS